MTFTAVGSVSDQTTNGFTLTPAGVGNLMMMAVYNTASATVWATNVSSTNVTWTQLGAHFAGSTNANTATMWMGTITAASGATLTVTWSGAAPATFRIVSQEYSSTAGSWAQDGSNGTVDAGTNVAMPSLTPAAAGELYYCYSAGATVSEVAGSTPGYTYFVDTGSNGLVYNPACTSSAQAPTWGAGSNGQFGIAVLIKETVTAVVSGPQVNRQLPNFPVYQVFSAGRMGGGHSF